MRSAFIVAAMRLPEGTRFIGVGGAIGITITRRQVREVSVDFSFPIHGKLHAGLRIIGGIFGHDINRGSVVLDLFAVRADRARGEQMPAHQVEGIA